jgi:hypothetical protein
VTEARRLLRDLGSWPFLRIERRGPRALLYGAVAGDRFATLDLSTGALTVDPDMGVGVDVVDAESRRAAEALIRRRVDLERFAPQLREASP